ncbi:hypothetical protein V5081_21630 [Enterobacter cancerogenus]|uniref:hypothetical protein n=1 Tax=Enterobacter cancerogenus TaxID=69218 RepID=UPI0030761D49
MNEHKFRFFYLMLFVVIIGGVIFGVYFQNTTQNLHSCKSKLMLRHGQFYLNAQFNFSFLNDRGFVTFSGEVTENNKKLIVDREIPFIYKKEGGSLMMTNTQIHFFSNDRGTESNLRNHMPDFFTRTNGEISLTIAYDEYKTPVLLIADTPLFYCQK